MTDVLAPLRLHITHTHLRVAAVAPDEAPVPDMDEVAYEETSLAIKARFARFATALGFVSVAVINVLPMVSEASKDTGPLTLLMSFLGLLVVIIAMTMFARFIATQNLAFMRRQWARLWREQRRDIPAVYVQRLTETPITITADPDAGLTWRSDTDQARILHQRTLDEPPPARRDTTIADGHIPDPNATSFDLTRDPDDPHRLCLQIRNARAQDTPALNIALNADLLDIDNLADIPMLKREGLTLSLADQQALLTWLNTWASLEGKKLPKDIRVTQTATVTA